MFIGTIILLLVASLLPLNSSASATSINRDSVASSISSNDETDDINSLLIEYNQIATSNYDNLLNSNDSIDEGCDISFPLAPSTLPSSHHGRQLKVAIPPYNTQNNNIQTTTTQSEQQWYETGEYYAPTCHDNQTNKRRIDIRYLEQCFGGACWDTQIGQCTFVCTWNKPTPFPTKQPTPPPTYEQVQTEHPLLLSLRNLPSDYRFNSELRAAILRYISDKLKADLKELDINMELIQITSPGRLPGKPHSIPLKISVNAPSDISDFALSYILQTLRDEIPVIQTSLSKLDGTSSFDEQQVQLIVETYNFDDVTDGYDTVAPSKSPTMEPEEVIVPSNVEYKDANEKQGTPWWVWLLVALVIISCLLGTCCYCTRLRNKDDKNELHGGGGQQQINLFLQNRMHHPTKDGQSVAMSHRSRQQQHPRVGNGEDAFLGQPIAVKRSSREDDVSRLTSRTKRSHKTSSSSRRRQQKRSGPPRELELATIPQEDPPEESVVNGESVVVGRDPTMYQEGYNSSSQLDPEGDKLSKKKSMFASGALMNEVHREREQQNQSSSSTRRRGNNMNRRKSMDKLVSSFRWTKKQPTEYDEGAIVAVPEPPEEYDTDYAANNNNKQKSSSTSKKNRRGNNMNRRKSMDKLVSSFRWTKKQDPIDIDMDELEDCPQIDLEVGSCDSPSILTNHNPGDGDLPRDRNPYQRDANTNEDYSGYERSNEKKKKKKKNKSAKKKTKKDGGGGTNRKAGRQNRTAGAFRSFRKSISWGDGRDAADDDSYDRD